MEFIQTQFYGISDDETGCCKIHATSAHRGAKKKQVNVCCDLQEELKNNTQLLIQAVSVDERWHYGYSPESKQQSISGSHQIRRHTPPPPHTHTQKSCGKFTQVSRQCRFFFFDVAGIVHREIVPPGQTENQQFYECVGKTA